MKVKILEVRVRCFVFSLTALTILLIGCGKDKPTQPANQGSILLSQLVVSMVPDGRDTVIVSATNADGAPSDCAISNSDPSVASVTQSDSTLVITGISYGTTNITLTNGSGKSCTLPVQVYNYQILDTGELLITYTDDFVGINNPTRFPLFRPIPPAGFVTLGSYCVPTHYNPNGREAMMVVKAKPGSDAIAFTDSFVPAIEPEWGFWMPIPPPGYVAMGMIAGEGTQRPDSVACIRQDLTIPGTPDDTIICDSRVWDHGFWKIAQPFADAHPGAYLAPGTFIVAGLVPPDFHSVANVLNVELPMLAEAPTQSFTPFLTSYDTPPLETVPRMAKAMLVPSSIINDSMHINDVGWQVANSPFYRLERQVFYRRIYFNNNTTSEVQTHSVSIESGIDASLSDRIWNETAVAISAEAGLNIKMFSARVTATVSQKFGYETQTSITELRHTIVTTSINTPPHKAAGAWQQFNRYVLYRHNGTRLEPVSSWEFGIDSYVVDEYPDN